MPDVCIPARTSYRFQLPAETGNKFEKNKSEANLLKESDVKIQLFKNLIKLLEISGTCHIIIYLQSAA